MKEKCEISSLEKKNWKSRQYLYLIVRRNVGRRFDLILMEIWI